MQSKSVFLLFVLVATVSLVVSNSDETVAVESISDESVANDPPIDESDAVDPLSDDFIDAINKKATTWKVESLSHCLCNRLNCFRERKKNNCFLL